jgi:hypothetical protein
MMMVVVMIPAIVVIMIPVRAVMMMVMMPPTVMVMMIIANICAGSPRMSAMVIFDRTAQSCLPVDVRFAPKAAGAGAFCNS